MSQSFASKNDLLAPKQITFEQLSEHAWAYTAEGDPKFEAWWSATTASMVLDATAAPALAP